MTCSLRIGYGRGPLGIEPATWATIARFFSVVFLMSLLQIWTDSIPRPTDIPECQVEDTFYMVIPNLPRWMGVPLMGHAADLWILVTILMMIVFIYFNSPAGQRQLYVRRWFCVWTYGYFFRFITIGLTHYLAPLRKGVVPYTPPNPFLGALLITVGVKSSLNDLMFSGHTMTWVLAARYVWLYGVNRMFRYFFVIWCMVGPILLVAVREHVSADVGVSFIVGALLFSWYHMWYVRGFRGGWLPVWEVEAAQPMRIVYPLRVVDGEGNTWTIGEDRKGRVELVGAGVTPERSQYMRLLQWFDEGDRYIDPHRPSVLTGTQPNPHPALNFIPRIGCSSGAEQI